MKLAMHSNSHPNSHSNSGPNSHSKLRRKKSAGVALLEILIAAIILLMGMTLGVRTLRDFWQHDNVTHQTQIQMRDGQWALQQISHAMRNAGFGEIVDTALDDLPAPHDWNRYLQIGASPVTWCADGLIAPAAISAQCRTSSFDSSNPTLVIRTLADSDSATTTSDGRVQDCLGNGVPEVGAAYREVRYSYNASTHQLLCQGNGRTDAMANLSAAQTILNQVMAFRVYFLSDTDDDAYIDREHEPSNDFSAWNQVRAVRVCVALNHPSESTTPSLYLDCDDHWQNAPVGQSRTILQQTNVIRNRR